jgi:hypothetical protein
VAAGNSYAGLLLGDLTCTSDSRLSLQKLVFARDAGGASPGEYKMLKIADRRRAGLTGLPPPTPSPSFSSCSPAASASETSSTATGST